MKLDSFHHVALIVSDYQRSRDFYTQVLGFKVEAENYRAEPMNTPGSASPSSPIQTACRWSCTRRDLGFDLTGSAKQRIPKYMTLLHDPSELKYKLQGLSERVEVLRGFL